MTYSIQSLPSELLGYTFLNLNDPDDIVDCKRVCREWYETIKTNSFSKAMIGNLLPNRPDDVIQCTLVAKGWEASFLFSKDYIEGLFPNVNLENFKYAHYNVLLEAILLISQHPVRQEIQSKEIVDLNTIAAEFEYMGNSNNHPEYQTRVSNRLGQLPENVQQNLYADLRKASKDNVYDSPEWGGIAFHSADSRRNLPSYSLKREVILAQVDEQKLRTLGHTLMHSSSERSKEKAIKQVSRLSPIVKNAIYQELKEILNRKGVFKELSGKEAFYNSEVPNLIKGAAIIVYINTKLRQLQ